MRPVSSGSPNRRTGSERMPLPRHIAVEGPIGVGKTSLTRRLAHHFGWETLLEGADENPFLPDYYRDPARHALATQLHFLCQRTQQLQALAQRDLFSPGLVADFMFEKDRIFAEISLNAEEFRLYEEIFTRFAPRVPTPDVVIYLVAPIRVLKARIAQRGIACEQRILPEYLGSLRAAYDRLFRDYQAAPVLLVETDRVDLLHDPRHFAVLTRALEAGVKGRQLLEPEEAGLFPAASPPGPARLAV